LRRRATASDARAGSGPGAAGAAPGRADLGPRSGRARLRGGDSPTSAGADRDLDRGGHARPGTGKTAGRFRGPNRRRPGRRAGPDRRRPRRTTRSRPRGRRHVSVQVAASSIQVTIGEVAAALALVAIAAIASRSWHAGLEEDIGIAVVRSFIQLTAIGYVIT